MHALKPLLLTYAYNILGSLADAEDVVQDAYLKFSQVEQSSIDNPEAYLKRMVINLSLNSKRNQRKKRLSYPGEWLPEPIATEQADGRLINKDVLSYSLMVLLEKLSPRQRAVFILKEAFDYEHEQIADVLNISPEYSRKILQRAKAQLKEDHTVQEAATDLLSVQKFLAVIQLGDTEALEQLLHEDIGVIADGGGKASAALKPILGRHGAVQMLAGLYRRFFGGLEITNSTVNHQPALLIYAAGQLVVCQVFSISNGIIDQVYLLRNPDKLQVLEKK